LLSQSRFVLEIVNQASLYACVQREISVPTELALGHLRCRVTDMPPQPNSPSGRCLETRLSHKDEPHAIGAVFTTVGSSRGPRQPEPTRLRAAPNGVAPEATPLSRESGLPPKSQTLTAHSPQTVQNHWSLHSISEATFRVVVFHLCLRFHLYYTSDVAAQSQTGVKLNRVFFPRLALQVRSLDCRFAR
jgi:hypothetical protein